MYALSPIKIEFDLDEMFETGYGGYAERGYMMTISIADASIEIPGFLACRWDGKRQWVTEPQYGNGLGRPTTDPLDNPDCNHDAPIWLIDGFGEKSERIERGDVPEWKMAASDEAALKIRTSIVETLNYEIDVSTADMWVKCPEPGEVFEGVDEIAGLDIMQVRVGSFYGAGICLAWHDHKEYRFVPWPEREHIEQAYRDRMIDVVNEIERELEMIS